MSPAGASRSRRQSVAPAREVAEPVNQAIHLREGRIEIAGGPYRFGDTEALQQRQRGHVAGPHRDTAIIQPLHDRGDGHPGQREGEDRQSRAGIIEGAKHA